jgi:thiosulfate reductase cytochrome b subunit
MQSDDIQGRHVRSGAERLVHWGQALAIMVLIASGWEIYNAHPIYPPEFPDWATLGTDLTTALLWHFAAMWLLFVCFTAWVIRRVLLQRGVPLVPVTPRGVVHDIRAAFRGRLPHDLSVYNQVQRALYLTVSLAIAFAIVTGFALWKPVQLSWLTGTLGGFDLVRQLHFSAMAAIATFLILHVVMALLVPRTILAMIVGLRKGMPDGDS